MDKTSKQGEATAFLSTRSMAKVNISKWRKFNYKQDSSEKWRFGIDMRRLFIVLAFSRIRWVELIAMLSCRSSVRVFSTIESRDGMFLLLWTRSPKDAVWEWWECPLCRNDVSHVAWAMKNQAKVESDGNEDHNHENHTKVGYCPPASLYPT